MLINCDHVMLPFNNFNWTWAFGYAWVTKLKGGAAACPIKREVCVLCG